MSDVDRPADYALTGPLCWRMLDDQWVLFSASAGALLRTDALTAAVCVLLDEGPASVTSLASRVAATMQIEISEVLLARIGDALDELLDSGIVECPDR